MSVFDVVLWIFALIGFGATALGGFALWAGRQEPMDPYDYDAGWRYKGMSDE